MDVLGRRQITLRRELLRRDGLFEGVPRELRNWGLDDHLLRRQPQQKVSLLVAFRHGELLLFICTSWHHCCVQVTYVHARVGYLAGLRGYGGCFQGGG